MTVQELVAALQLQVISPGQLGQEIHSGYASDLLSCVMARAQAGSVWITLQAHPNVVAVASLLDLAAVIIAEGVVPDIEVKDRAQEKGVTLLGSPQTAFTIAGRMSALAIPGTE
jgi:succinyl-CoA synthetase alpha subunit